VAVDSSDVQICPSILTDDPNEFQRCMTLYPTFCRRIQIDVVDGGFVATTTISDAAITQLPEGVLTDIHMMVLNPSEHMQNIVRLKPNLCIFHAEVGEDLLPIFKQLHDAGIKAGVCLLQRTYPESVKHYIAAADHVLVFAGSLGKQGGTADLLQVEKVKLIRAINPSVEIGWDGGVGLNNVRTLAHSDINVLTVGSYIEKADDAKKAYDDLENEKSQRGIAI